MSRDGDLLGKIKTYGLITFITAMIWVFAEAESVATRPGVRAEVTFDFEPGVERYLQIPENQGWRDRVDVTLQGTSAAISDVESVLRRPVKVRLSGSSAEPGEHVIDLATAIEGVAGVAGTGVTVEKADPPTLRITVDQLVTRELRVEVDAPGGELDGPAEARPAVVSLRLPRTDAELLAANTVVRARISGEALAKLVPGRRETMQKVALTLPPLLANRGARLDPDAVEVSLTLKSRTATYTIPSVPVHLKLAAVEAARWDITVPTQDLFISDVRVSGPNDLVDQVRRGDLKVTAIAALSFDELERGITSKRVTFSADAPGDLRFEADKASVRLEIKRRAQPGPAGPPGASVPPLQTAPQPAGDSPKETDAPFTAIPDRPKDPPRDPAETSPPPAPK